MRVIARSDIVYWNVCFLQCMHSELLMYSQVFPPKLSRHPEDLLSYVKNQNNSVEIVRNLWEVCVVSTVGYVVPAGSVALAYFFINIKPLSAYC